MSNWHDAEWRAENEHYWDDDLPRSFPDEEEEDADPTK